MDIFYLFILLFFLFLIVCFTVKWFLERKKLKKKIEDMFGAEPSDRADLHSAAGFWAAYQETHPQENSIDNITWHDLDMDALFCNLHSCQSDVGAALLYQQLRRGPAPPEEAQKRERYMEGFAKDDALRSKAQYALALLGKTRDKHLETGAFHPETLQTFGLPLYLLPAGAPLLSLLLFFFIGPAAALVVFLLASTNFALTHYLRHRSDGGFSVAYGFAAILARAPKLANLCQAATPSLSEEIHTTLHEFKRTRTAVFIMRSSEALFSLGLVDIFSCFLLPILCYVYLARVMQTQKEGYLRLITLLGEIDLSISILSTRKRYPFWCKPTWTTEKELSFGQLYHPMLQDAVPNNAAFTRDVLLTGSNASGKSTFIKAVAINCITAQALNTCFAQAFCLRRAAVLTSMAIKDNLFEGDSYFVAELKSMKRIVDKAESGAFCYVFIDEILRGTNTTERIAASTAVLQFLARPHCFVVAATHDLELTQLLAKPYDNYHFRETIQDNGVAFDFTLHGGPSHTKNAILLMDFMHFPKTIVADANQKVALREQKSP